MRICKIDDCNYKHHANGYCSKHNSKFRLYGDPLAGKEIELHGMSKTLEYITWGSMIQRCYDPNHKSYKNYGGRGITVCKRWRDSFTNFYNDMGIKPIGKELDRKKNNLDYCLNNCRWITKLQNNRNKRSNVVNEFTVKSVRRLFAMKKYTHTQLCKIYNIKQGTLEGIIYNKIWIGV